MPPGRHRQRGEGLRPAGPRRRRIPLRREVGFIKPGGPKPTYLICNADESEPGTFKDRYIIHQDPHQLIEGMIISCFGVQAHLAYIYIRGEFPEGARILEKALGGCPCEGFPSARNISAPGFDLDIYVHRGAGRTSAARRRGPHRVAQGQARLPAHQAALFSRGPGLTSADHRQ